MQQAEKAQERISEVFEAVKRYNLKQQSQVCVEQVVPQAVDKQKGYRHGMTVVDHTHETSSKD